MSQRFRAAVNRKRKSQARLHVARWSSQSINIAFSLALFNRVWNNYTLRKSDHDTSFPRRYGHERRYCNVYNIYSYAMLLIAALLSLETKNETRRVLYLCCTNEVMKCNERGWIRKQTRQLIMDRAKGTTLSPPPPSLKDHGRAPTLIIFSTRRAWPAATHSAFDLKFKAPRGAHAQPAHNAGVNFLQKPLPPRAREWGGLLKGRQGRRTWASELSLWERYERRSNIGGNGREGRLSKEVRVHTRTHAHARARASKGVYATRVHTANARPLRAWRTKAPGKRKDVVKKTTGERAGDASRSSSHRRYYTRYGKLVLTVSAVDFRLAPVGEPCIRLRERHSVRNVASKASCP